MIGGQTGVAGHLKIGNQIRIQAQSGINRDVQDGETLLEHLLSMLVITEEAMYFSENSLKLLNRINNLEKTQRKY